MIERGANDSDFRDNDSKSLTGKKAVDSHWRDMDRPAKIIGP